MRYSDHPGVDGWVYRKPTPLRSTGQLHQFGLLGDNPYSHMPVQIWLTCIVDSGRLRREDKAANSFEFFFSRFLCHRSLNKFLNDPSLAPFSR